MQESAPPLISVIVPVYNSEAYLRRCLDSIAAQTYRNLEILVVDDGSTDDSPAICDAYARRDARFRAIRKENGGASSARNAGLAAMRGAYVAFLDSDDFFAPTMIEALYRRMASDASQLAICAMRFVNERGEILPTYQGQKGAPDGIWDQRAFWKNMPGRFSFYCVSPCNKLYAAALFDGVRYDEGKFYEDERILHKLIARCERISCLEPALYNCTRRRGSLSAQSAHTIRQLDYIEGLIARALHQYERGFCADAQNTLAWCVRQFMYIHRALPNMPGADRQRFDAARRTFHAARLAVARGKVSRHVYLDIMTFDIHPRLYLLARALRERRVRLLRSAEKRREQPR